LSKKKQIDPIPEEFASYEEAAEFWDAHDTTDYPDAFRPVSVEAKFRKRHYEIEIDADVVRALQRLAQQKGVTLSHLVSNLLRRLMTSK
jgi:aryl-alcohol dehydrogenase-like predicted oxidoreductase